MKHQVKKRTGRGGVSCIARRKRSFNTLVIFFLLFAAASLTIGTTSAEATEMDFNIPAQTLSSALKTFAEDTGLQMLYSSDTVKGIRSSRVNGRHQPKEALNILLGGTGLSFKFTDSNTVVVQKNEGKKAKKLIAQREVEKSEAAEEKEEVKRPLEMEEMVVTATKSEMNVREVPASVSVVTAEDIELMPVANTFEEALRFTPGVYVERFGTLGNQPIKVRGQRPAFLINGREVTQFNSSSFPGELVGMDAIERIEVIRGPQSAVHGSKAISGVINIITKKGDKENPYVQVNALAGEGEEIRGGMSIGGGCDKFSYFITCSGSNQKEVETPRGIATEEAERRNVYARLDYDVNDKHTVGLEYLYGNARHFEHHAYPHKYYTLWKAVSEMDPCERESVFLNYKGEITDWFSLYAYFGFGRSDYGWKNGDTVEEFLDPAQQDHTDFLEDHKWGEVRGNFDILDGDLLTATVGVQYKESDLDVDSVDPGWDYEFQISENEKYIAPYLQLQSKPIDYLLVSAGVRYDKYSYREASDKEQTSPKLGFSVFPFAYTDYDWTTIWASYNEGFRAPRGSELYSGHGNPDLEPEKSEGWEIGLKQRLGYWANIEVTYFDIDYTEKIHYDYAASKWRNIGEANDKGYELLAEVYPIDFLRLFVTYMDLEQKDTKNNTVIYGQPYNILTLGFSIEDFHGIYFAVSGKQKDDWKYVGWGSPEPYNHPSEGDWLWDAKLSYNWNITSNALFKPFISVENLADKEYYPAWTICEGRAWHIGASLKVNF